GGVYEKNLTSVLFADLRKCDHLLGRYSGLSSLVLRRVELDRLVLRTSGGEPRRRHGDAVLEWHSLLAGPHARADGCRQQECERGGGADDPIELRPARIPHGDVPPYILN